MKQVGDRGTRSHRSLNPLVAGIISFFMLTGALAGANSVQADSVWVQSYERSSQTQACVAQAGETPWQDSWGTNPGWSPSWELWANNGNGGWTCTRSITWARSEAPQFTYRLGDIGPGGGLIFLINNGLTYEMAPKNWGSAEATGVPWCNVDLNITDAVGTAIGTGVTNTQAMVNIPCSSGAGNSAVAYTGGGYTDWFLPSKDELNAMCNYSRNPSDPAASSVLCSGPQDSAFAADSYGFAEGIGIDFYWSSSQWETFGTNNAWLQYFADGTPTAVPKVGTYRVRPVRVF